MEIDQSTAKLEGAAEDLKRCSENLIHEDDIRERAPSMTLTQYHSLKAGPFQGGSDPRNSVMLQWLKLALNSTSLNFGGTVQVLRYILKRKVRGKSHLI